MWHERRDIDEVSRPGFRHILEPLTPAHPRLPAHDVDDALQLAVMMHAGLRVWLNRDRARPDLLGSDPGVVDGRLTEHARGLGCVGVEPVALDHPYAIMLPPLVHLLGPVLLPVTAHGCCSACPAYSPRRLGSHAGESKRVPRRCGGASPRAAVRNSFFAIALLFRKEGGPCPP